MRRLSRVKDPITSKLAAKGCIAFSGTHKQKIMDGLRHLGVATAKELEDLIGLSVVQIDRRLPELLQEKKVCLCKIRGVVMVKCGYRVWRIK